MAIRLVMTVAGCFLIGAGVLALRQERLQTQHEIARLHNAIDQHRMEVWDLQVELSQSISPPVLKEILQREAVALAPMVPAAEQAGAALADTPTDAQPHPDGRVLGGEAVWP